jgi:hypothetical protein
MKLKGINIITTWPTHNFDCLAAHGASRYKARVCNIPPPLAGVGGSSGNMESQLSPDGVDTAAATEAGLTNGGKAGITVTEPDTSTMQKQSTGLSTSFCLPVKPKFIASRVCNMHTLLQHKCLLQFLYLIGHDVSVYYIAKRLELAFST